MEARYGFREAWTAFITMEMRGWSDSWISTRCSSHEGKRINWPGLGAMIPMMMFRCLLLPEPGRQPEAQPVNQLHFLESMPKAMVGGRLEIPRGVQEIFMGIY